MNEHRVWYYIDTVLNNGDGRFSSVRLSECKAWDLFVRWIVNHLRRIVATSWLYAVMV